MGNAAASTIEAIYAYGYTPDSHVTLNLPAPITISGNSMALSLDLLVSKSASWTAASCPEASGATTFSITPTFNLEPASVPTLAMKGLGGMIASVDAAANTLTLTASDGASPGIDLSGATVTWNAPTWQVSANAGTVFQGVSGLSSLEAGMPVELDATLQPDGSLAASRIEVFDTNTTTLSTSTGPLANVFSTGPELGQVVSEASGNLFTQGTDALGGWQAIAYDSAVFQTSGELSNLQSLPFTPSFTAQTMVAGQNVYLDSHATSWPWAPNYPELATVTLLPQTINGIVTAESSDAGFDTYTVSLMPYDLFPALAVQGLQTTVLSNPYAVVVYADSSTQMLNSQPIVIGSVVRFNGLIFNDSGTLRMDCAQINDGVQEIK
jgi:hypothetical protein